MPSYDTISGHFSAYFHQYMSWYIIYELIHITQIYMTWLRKKIFFSHGSTRPENFLSSKIRSNFSNGQSSVTMAHLKKRKSNMHPCTHACIYAHLGSYEVISYDIFHVICSEKHYFSPTKLCTKTFWTLPKIQSQSCLWVWNPPPLACC